MDKDIPMIERSNSDDEPPESPPVSDTEDDIDNESSDGKSRSS